MYPIFRMGKEMAVNWRAKPLGFFETHVSHHICWPWDLDFWFELNNGRTLTLFDLGRVPHSIRIGIIGLVRKKSWGMAVAGVSVRYRKRVRAFHKVEMRTRLLGWDDRFIYMEQSLWRKGQCTGHMLLRAAVTDKNGIVPPEHVPEAMGIELESPALPDWAQAWIDADAIRPWPPEANPHDN